MGELDVQILFHFGNDGGSAWTMRMPDVETSKHWYEAVLIAAPCCNDESNTVRCSIS